MDIINFISLLSSAAGGLIIVSYEEFARQNLWPVGNAFRGTGVLKILGGLSFFGTLIATVIWFSWTWGIAVFAASFIVAFILTYLLKSTVQFVSILMLVGSYLMQIFIN